MDDKAIESGRERARGVDSYLLDPTTAYEDEGVWIVETSTFVGAEFTDAIEDYERLADFHGASAQEDMKRQLRVWLEPISGRRDLHIFEVGCGTGFLTSALLDMPFDISTYIANDISPAMLRRTKEILGAAGREQSALCFLAADAGQRMFMESQFDAVVASSVLHHILDWRSFLEEVHLVLTPGGVFAASEPLARSYQFVAAVLQIHVWERDVRGDPLDPASVELVNSLCDNLVARGNGGLGAKELAALDDKHLFDEAEVLQHAHDVGFTGARWIDRDPSERHNITDLIEEVGLGLGAELFPRSSPPLQVLDRLLPGLMTREFPPQKFLQLIR